MEYWGVNRAGEVPAGWTTSTAEYKRGMAWKRDQFQREGKGLVEFYDYERTEGTLDAALRERLTRAGIVLRPMTFEEVGTSFGDLKYIGSSIEKLLVQFITNARAMRREPKEIQPQLKRSTPRVHHFGLLGIAVLERYQAALSAEGRIDFSDMLHQAADILESGTNPLPKFKHVLVDEFQDTSAALVRQELHQVPANRILVLSRTNHLLEDIIEACRRNGVPVGNPDRDVPGVRILSAHKAKGLEADVVIVANASDHIFGFPSKVENPAVLEPVRMSAGDAQAEERRLFYFAITRD